ncbi:MAG: ABC transporter substrate-binding protein [Xanthobacteraceae bacterium]|nr:ABC transporter substrate-binding protein [Xanthobacteraceae bacterium]MBX3522079.1 ABC transporter substrate-binding protein [Xanthobacteraceae bacterium]MBX3548473.1 ABC transporter substrate-binding protein [Xanthobacteraceae bacterium]MCW5674015.1 ABC transporter substrate-binding protein [Xanthobacteraceae bacterium]MCW5678173.1 ABC transporter substrate-binding protein [Xanthobacteraceae bacterium]
MTTSKKLRIGFIPLVDAAALIVAIDKGFAAEEGLDVELVREVSWSNVRDKLNIGLFDAAHLLAPVAIASNLGIGHVRVPIIAPFNLGLNGNAITVTNALKNALEDKAEGDLTDPKMSAKALAAIVAERKRKGQPPLNFGMTFPFSTHNYQLRFWMASAGVDPDEDVQMVVLPPPFMVESIVNGHVDAFCVGAPWNSVAVDLGIAHILHFVSEILQRAAEKVLALRTTWAAENPESVAALVRAHKKAADFIEDEANREESCRIISAPNRLNVEPEITRRTLDGRLKVSPDGNYRESERYLMVGRRGAARPDRTQASWLYAQMVRWGQAPLSNDLLMAARETFRPDIYDEVLGAGDLPPQGEPEDGVGAFDGPEFDPFDLEKHLATWKVRRR